MIFEFAINGSVPISINEHKKHSLPALLPAHPLSKCRPLFPANALPPQRGKRNYAKGGQQKI